MFVAVSRAVTFVFADRVSAWTLHLNLQLRFFCKQDKFNNTAFFWYVYLEIDIKILLWIQASHDLKLKITVGRIIFYIIN